MSKKGKHPRTPFNITLSCKKIRKRTLSGHNNIISITILKSVIEISEDAFNECNNLVYIDVAKENPNYKSKDGILYNKEGTKIIWFPKRLIKFKCIDGILYNKEGTEIIYVPKGLTGSIKILNGVTCIKDHAFSGCNKLTHIFISESVIEIGSNAFEGCINLARIKVADDNPYFKSIGGILYNKKRTVIIHAPMGLKGSIKIPNGVTHIKDHAFSGCNKLTNITIPKSVTQIGFNAFDGCIKLAHIDVADKNLNYKRSEDGILYNKKGTEIIYVPKGLTGSIEILNGVTHIKDYEFSGCNKLTNITIPENVIEIGEEAFKGCSNLDEVHYKGNAPTCGNENKIYSGTPESLTSYYPRGNNSWESTIQNSLWQSRNILPEPYFRPYWNNGIIH